MEKDKEIVILKEADFRKEIKNAPRTGYFFFGEEDYLKGFAVRQAREVAVGDPAFAIFNEIVLDSLDFTPDKLLDALQPLPMMSERKLVLVKGLNFKSMDPSTLNTLCEVLEELPNYDYNLLIITASADCFDCGKLPKSPSTALSRLSEHLMPVQFERCTTAKLAVWAQKHFAHNGIEASPTFCNKMVEYCGHDMFVLSNEIDKLCFYLSFHKKTEPTDDAMYAVCTPANEYNIFDFTNAIMDGRADVAIGILADYKRRRMDPKLILGEVTGVICDMATVASLLSQGASPAEISLATKIHSFRLGLYQKSLCNSPPSRLQKALDACAAADAALKSYQQDEYAILERLICGL